MIEKRLLQQVLHQIKTGALTVSYWDGTTQTYGTGVPYFHLTIHKPLAIRAMLRNMTIGFGESYMSGLIDIDGDLRNVGRLVSENSKAFSGLQLTKFPHLPMRNTRRRQMAQIQRHYDLGNDFYGLWLDKSMTYSCGYFKKPSDSLEKAQEQKVHHVLNKLQLEPAQHLLDVGSGWGTLLITAAKEYGVGGLGITLSQRQLEYSRQAAENAGVGDKVVFELLNYRDLATQKEFHGAFDRVVSVGMFEHVGRNNQRLYYRAINRLLKPGGVSVLHTISTFTQGGGEPWIDKYIFPGGYLPSTHQIMFELPRYNFDLIDYENLRLHYTLTLDEWLRRYQKHQQEIIAMYDKKFDRMWRLYLASSSSGFRYGDLRLSQFVFTKGLNNDLALTRDHLYQPANK